MTFPTKESLLRNLNERDVSEVFLIVANFKSLAEWNLISLRNITILLGPNSAGKSTIHEAIQAIRDFDDGFLERMRYGYRSDVEGEEPCFGFSMPFVLEDRVESASMADLLLNAATAGVPDTAIPEEISEDFGWHFILEGLLTGKYLHEPCKSLRYTLIGLPCFDYVRYEVYFNDELASIRHRYDLSSGESDDDMAYGYDDGPGDAVTFKILPCANNQLYYPSIAFRSQQKSSSKNETLKGCIGWTDNLDAAWNISTLITYRILQGEHAKLREYLPLEVFSNNARESYGSRHAAFCMIIALYSVCYHRFLEYTAGIQTDDVRTLDSIAVSFNTLVANEISNKKRDLEPPKNKFEMLAEGFAVSFIYRDKPHAFWARQRRVSEIVNRWLREKAFLDSRYQLKFSLTISIPIEFFDENLAIKPEYIDNVQRGADVQYSGRAYITDEASRELSLENIGAGYSQVLPILIGLADRSTLLFKQPEVHLHPRLQSRIADCFVETVFNEKQNKESRVRIIETHSEHFVLRLLRRLRESSFDELYHSSLTVYPEDVAFVYFQPQGDSTRVHEIAVLPSGEFVDGWPDGFFDERDEDLWGTPSPRGR